MAKAKKAAAKKKPAKKAAVKKTVKKAAKKKSARGRFSCCRSSVRRRLARRRRSAKVECALRLTARQTRMSGSSRFVFHLAHWVAVASSGGDPFRAHNVTADSDSAGPTAPSLGAMDVGARRLGKPDRLP